MTSRTTTWTGAGLRPSMPLLAAAIVVTATALLPLAFVAWASLSAGLDTMAPLVMRPRVGELAVNTLALVAITVPLAAGLGVAAAWLVERCTFPGRRVMAWLLAAPLVIPAFVASYGWVTVVPSLAGLPAGVLVATLAYYPLIYLPVVAALRRLDPALEEVAAALGRPPGAVFRTVVLPQLRLPVLGGALLVGLHLLAEYGAFAMLRFETFTTAIVQQYQSTFNGPAAAALAMVLTVACLLLLAAEAAARGRTRFARLGSGVGRRPRRLWLGSWAWPAAAAAGALIAIAVGVPMASVGRWLLRGGAEAWADPQLLRALGQTAGLGLAGAVAATLLALPVAVISIRHPSRASRGLEAANYVASSLPGIVIALAMATIAIRLVQPLYQSTIVLVLAYAILFLPRSLVSLRAGIAQVPPVLDEVAQSLGRRPVIAFLAITARLAAPAALAGGALVFLGVVNELTATLLLGPIGTRTLTTQFWTHVNDLDYALASPYAILMILLSLPMLVLLFRSGDGPDRQRELRRG